MAEFVVADHGGEWLASLVALEPSRAWAAMVRAVVRWLSYSAVDEGLAASVASSERADAVEAADCARMGGEDG